MTPNKKQEEHEIDVSIYEEKGWGYTLWKGMEVVETSDPRYVNSYAALDAGKERREEIESGEF